MSWGVRLAARMPAVRATPSTSPLGALPRRITRRVAGAILRTARATASRTVSRLSETSTMRAAPSGERWRSEEHTSELQSQSNLVCRLLLEKKKKIKNIREDLYAPTSTNQLL